MKKKFTFLILFFFSLYILGQNTDKNNLSFGLFIGEGSGILTNFSISDQFGIELNITYHELFYKYPFPCRCHYPLVYIDQSHNNIYSSSLLLNYKNKFTGINKLEYHFAIGGQIRLITDYYGGEPVWLSPPNPPTIIITPLPEDEIELGINSLKGIKYLLNENISVFFDLGVYAKIGRTPFAWSNFLFRTGLMYHINL